MSTTSTWTNEPTITIIRHWFPILTYCPVNNLPDLIYITLEFDSFVELYHERKRIRKLISGRRIFMEDIAKELRETYPQAKTILVRLLFDRHLVINKRGKQVV